MPIDYSIIGKRFGRLEVTELSHINKNRTYWGCKCDCGNYKTVFRGSLTSGDTISCGCYWEENKHKHGYKHGMSNSTLYKKWSSMIQRSTNENHKRYNAYGGRGIKVCDEWYDFENFYNWAITNGYMKNLSIERINVDGDYEPSNCKWILMKDQYENRQSSKLITYNGKTQSISRWSKELGINRETLRYRVYIAKWDLDRAFSK